MGAQVSMALLWWRVQADDCSFFTVDEDLSRQEFELLLRTYPEPLLLTRAFHVPPARRSDRRSSGQIWKQHSWGKPQILCFGAVLIAVFLMNFHAI